MVEDWMSHAIRVRRLARCLSRPGCDADELYTVGLWGLYQAAESFDPSRGVLFWTHAAPRVAGEIKDFKRHTFGKTGKHAKTLHLTFPVGVNDRYLAAVDDRDELDNAARLGLSAPRRQRVTANLPDGLSLNEWAARMGISISAMFRRIKRYGVRQALRMPRREGKRRGRVPLDLPDGLTVSEWARRLGLTHQGLYGRIKRNGIEAAIAMGTKAAQKV